MLLRADAIDHPFDPAVVFGRPGPLVLEIGFGDGRFTCALAREHPDWNILAVDISAGSVARGLPYLRGERAGNVRLFHGDGRFVARNFVAPRSLTSVLVNFPDPWPKARHADKRLLRAPFLERLSTRLIDRGEVLLTTDHEKYWSFTCDEARATGLYDVDVTPPPAEHLTTKYARKWQRRGRRFYFARLTKRGEHPEPWPVRERLTMPHALMFGALPELETFEKVMLPLEPAGQVVFLDAYRALDARSYTFLVHVEEEDIVQQILVEARPSARGVHVGLVNFAAPIATQGVHTAVDWLTGWLEKRGLVMVERWYRQPRTRPEARKLRDHAS